MDNDFWFLNASAPLPPVHHVAVEDGDDDDVGEAERHRDLHEHGGDTQARALLGVSTDFRESFTLYNSNPIF